MSGSNIPSEQVIDLYLVEFWGAEVEPLFHQHPILLVFCWSSKQHPYLDCCLHKFSHDSCSEASMFLSNSFQLPPVSIQEDPAFSGQAEHTIPSWLLFNIKILCYCIFKFCIYKSKLPIFTLRLFVHATRTSLQSFWWIFRW